MAKGRTRDPEKKKRDSRERDSRTEAEAPHAFRKQWPKKRAQAQRSERRRVNQSLDPGDPESESKASSQRREQVKKWRGTSVKLSERITKSQEARARKGTRNKP